MTEPGTAGPTVTGHRRSVSARVLIAPIRFYQRFITPYTPATCRYYPTCSSYAVTALGEYGAVRGIWLAVRRLGRCHPWSAGGIDHVPARVPAPAPAGVPPLALAHVQDCRERHRTPVRSPGADVPAVTHAGPSAPPTDRSNAA